jgi:hypothetical protein
MPLFFCQLSSGLFSIDIHIEGAGHRAKIYPDSPKAVSLWRAYRSAYLSRQSGFSLHERLKPVKDGFYSLS